jgi:hypothetical protein
VTRLARLRAARALVATRLVVWLDGSVEDRRSGARYVAGPTAVWFEHCALRDAMREVDALAWKVAA